MTEPDEIPPVQPNGQGGSGADYGDGLKTQRLERRALAKRWPIREDAKQAMVDRQIRIAIDPTTPIRSSTQAFLAVVKADALNVAMETRLPDPVAGTVNNTQINVYLNDPAQLDKLTDDELARCHKETLAVSGQSPEPGGSGS